MGKIELTVDMFNKALTDIKQRKTPVDVKATHKTIDIHDWFIYPTDDKAIHK